MGHGNQQVAKVLQPAKPGMVRPTFQSAGPMQPGMVRPQILPPNLGISIAANASVQAGTGPRAQSVAGSSKFVPAPRSDINAASKGSHQPSVVRPKADVRPRKWGGRTVPRTVPRKVPRTVPQPQRHAQGVGEKSWAEAAQPQHTSGSLRVARKVPPPATAVAERSNGKRPRSWEGAATRSSAGSEKTIAKTQSKQQPWVKGSPRILAVTNSSINTGTTKKLGVPSKWISQASAKQRAAANVRVDKDRDDGKNPNRPSSKYETRGREATKQQTTSSTRWQATASKDSHKQSHTGRSFGDKGGHGKTYGKDRSHSGEHVSYNQNIGKGNQSIHGKASHQGGVALNRGTSIGRGSSHNPGMSGGTAIGHPGSRRSHGVSGGGRSWK